MGWGCVGLFPQPNFHHCQQFRCASSKATITAGLTVNSSLLGGGDKGSWDRCLSIQPPLPSSCVQFCSDCSGSQGGANVYRRGSTKSMSTWGHHPCCVQPSARVALLPVLCLLLRKVSQGEHGGIPLSLLALRRRGRHFSNSWECSLMVKYLSIVGGHGFDSQHTKKS